MPKDKEAAKKREQYEIEVREASEKKNNQISLAKENYRADVKEIRKRIYG